ncbi:hypothetical protein RFI_21450 [Reticulomyxa filosa]|uniref:Uncharacterized protein n=1 Tax=Reticulomyxa filosa TaxID=46433 RepID=X6MQ13_RETFI|nr:hypothetical protein RFI_21450 [Reticulomyxa filosa]|eukprot:ETO15914.1 hypothetical protein RFI_21450 [Reticulomyxa filosa]
MVQTNEKQKQRNNEMLFFTTRIKTFFNSICWLLTYMLYKSTNGYVCVNDLSGHLVDIVGFVHLIGGKFNFNKNVLRQIKLNTNKCIGEKKKKKRRIPVLSVYCNHECCKSNQGK